MAHGMQQFDWMVSVKERPWHGIGTVVEDAPDSLEAIKMAKLDWSVEQEEVKTESGILIPETFANIRRDTNEVLGVVKSQYKILQNTEAFDFVDEVVKNSQGVECRYETAGSLFNGRKIYLLVKLPNVKICGDDVENYLFFMNSHDGSTALTAGITSVRVVCNNTLQFALKSAPRMWKIRHTSTLKGRVKEAIHSLELADNHVDEMATIAEKMAMTKIKEEDFIRKFFETKELKTIAESEISRAKLLERLDAIHENTDDLGNMKNTAWGWYNVVSDYVSNRVYERTGETHEDRKLNKFFVGEKMLKAAFDVLKVA